MKRKKQKRLNTQLKSSKDTRIWLNLDHNRQEKEEKGTTKWFNREISTNNFSKSHIKNRQEKEGKGTIKWFNREISSNNFSKNKIKITSLKTTALTNKILGVFKSHNLMNWCYSKIIRNNTSNKNQIPKKTIKAFNS